MIRITRSRHCTILACGLLAAVAGCADSQRFPRSTMPALEPVRQPATDTQHAESGTPGMTAEVSGSPTDEANPATGLHPETADAVAASKTPDFAASPDSPQMVSLWGDELVDYDHNGATPLDGSGNIRQISFGSEGSTFDPDVDRSGQWLVYASTRHRATADLYLQPVGGTSVTQLTSDPAHDIMPEFDPVGNRIAFASDRSGNWDVFVVSADGGRPVQLTNDREPELHPTWSPDGRRLAYCRFGARSKRWEIWVVDVENPSTPSFLTFGLFPQWCPDVATSKILFQRARERGSRFHSIWTVDYVDGDARRPTEILSAGNAALINPAWSPDGQRVVFITVVEPETDPDQRPEQSDVWVVDLDGQQRVNLTNGNFANYQPVWASGGTVFFVSNRSGVDNLWAIASTDANDSVNSVVNVAPDSGGQP